MQKIALAIAAALPLALSGCSSNGGNGDGPHTPAAPQPGQVCGEGWCWSNPLPQGGTLAAVWGAAYNDVWAAGERLLHYDGKAWSEFASPLATGDRIAALWGTSASDVWAAGDVLMHWDGKTWSDVTPQRDTSFPLLSGTGAKDLWTLFATGDGPQSQQTIEHWDGSKWSASDGPLPATLNGLYAASASSVFVVGVDPSGSGSLVLHWDGKSWSQEAAPAKDLLRGVWASGDFAVAVGGGSILQRSAAGWRLAGSLDPSASLSWVTGTSTSDVWAGGTGAIYHFDGKVWTQAWASDPKQARLVKGIALTGARDAWAVGDGGLMVHSDGVAWTQFSTGSIEQFEGVSATAPGDAWAVGGHGTALHWDGAAWTATSSGTQEVISAVAAISSGDVIAAGSSADCNGFVLKWNGLSWSSVFAPPAGICVDALAATGADNIWAAGSSSVFHSTGSAWQELGPKDASGAVWSASASDTWALQVSPPGSGVAPGGIYHFDGTNWTLGQTTATATLEKVWGSGSKDVWASSDDGAHLTHWDGAQWSQVASSLDDGSPPLDALWGSAATDVWASGRAGLPILHWDGHSWKAATTRTFGITAFATDSAGTWAVGANGMILRHSK